MSWNPATFEEAQHAIDTANAGLPFWFWGKMWAKRMAARIPPNPAHRTVVDYGCGIGRVIVNMPTESRRVGIDISERMIALARGWLAWTDIEFLVGDGQTVPLPDASVDFFFSLLVLQHMSGPAIQSMLRDAHRVLRPGGRMVHLIREHNVEGMRTTVAAIGFRDVGGESVIDGAAEYYLLEASK